MSPSPWIPSAPAATKESIELGKKLYAETGCLKCHGNLGRGDGPSAPTLMDELGQPIRAANLAQSWTFRGGSSREDIFRTMSTGFNGTPMPSFTDSLSAEQRWAITDFIVSLSGSGRAAIPTSSSPSTPGSDRSGEGGRELRIRSCRRFPIIGQIMEPGRAFHPPATSVTVQAIYDAESIALLVRWHDMSAEKTGKNVCCFPCRRRRRSRRLRGAGSRLDWSVFGDAEVAPAEQAAADPFAEAARRGRPAIGILRRGLDPDSVAGADGRPQALLHLRRRPELRGSLVLDLARPDPFIHRPWKRGIAANDTGDLSGVASYDQGEWSVIFKRPLRASSGAAFAQDSSCRSPSRSGTGFRASVATGEVSRPGPPLRRARGGPIRRRPDVEDGMLILLIELPVSAGCDGRVPAVSRARENCGSRTVSRAHPAATRA